MIYVYVCVCVCMYIYIYICVYIQYILLNIYSNSRIGNICFITIAV